MITLSGDNPDEWHGWAGDCLREVEQVRRVLDPLDPARLIRLVAAGVDGRRTGPS